MLHLSRISRWAVLPCLVINMLSMGVAAGKTRLTEVGNRLCNAPLGTLLTHANSLSLPALSL